MYFHRKKYAANRDPFSLFVGVEASVTWHPGLSQWGPLSGLFVDSQRLIARSQNRTKYVKYIWLSYPTWPSRWVLCFSMQWLRLKGCHVAWDEWTSGEICSLQHMWVIGSVMWAAASDESLKFGVQVATATNWFSRVNGARDNGIWLYSYLHVQYSPQPRLLDLFLSMFKCTCYVRLSMMNDASIHQAWLLDCLPWVDNCCWWYTSL